MPFIIMVTSGKEKVVKAFLAERGGAPSLKNLLGMGLDEHADFIKGLDCSISPMSGYLVSEATTLPQGIREVPYIHSVTEATLDQIRGMMTTKAEEKIAEGMMVKVVQGEYINFMGIVRKIEGNDATVDLSIYQKMVAVIVPCDDLQEVSNED